MIECSMDTKTREIMSKNYIWLPVNNKTTTILETYNKELCTWFDKVEFSFFPYYKNNNLFFALLCTQVCKPDAVGRGIATRTKVEEIEKMTFVF